MKRGIVWLVLLSSIILVLSLGVTAKTFDFTGCWGVSLCNNDYACGTMDGVCPDDYFQDFSKPYNDSGCAKSYDPYARCIDPDCSVCINGTITKRAPNPPDPLPGVSIEYEQEIWNGTSNEFLTFTTTTDANGKYELNVPAGNEIYILSQLEGFTPELTGPLNNIDTRLVGSCYEVNISMRNGTCQPDCTRLGSSYCDKSCHGQGEAGDLCIYNQTNVWNKSDYTGNVQIDRAIDACSRIGTQIGSFATLGNYTHATSGIRMCVRVNCCDNDPFEVPCPESDVSEKLINGDILADAVKVTRVAKNKGEPIKIRVYYWED